MTSAQPIISTQRVEAYVASALRLLGWLLAAILRLNPAGRSVRLKRLLSFAERSVESILFLKAVALYGPPPQQRRSHPRFASSGFRRIENTRLRLFFRGAGIRARKAGALARVLALIEALTRPERAVAYFLKQLSKRLHLGRIVPVAPPARRLAAAAVPIQTPSPDTS